MNAASAPASSDSLLASPVRWLWLVALASLACRGWLSAALPMTGDEATFYGWARFLDYGYYDHPPMVGWWIAGMRAVLGDAPWAIRLPAVLLPLGVGAALWWAWSPADRHRAAWAVLFYWLAPINWLNALIVTDTPLILFAAWSTAAMVRAVRAESQGHSAWGLHALAGVFIGLAFLSKYFAVMLGIAFAVHVLTAGRARWRGFVWMVLWALPAAALNVAWNLDHCWTNVMFNLFNRNEGAEGSWGTVAEYLAMLAYLLGPVMLWNLWRQRQALVVVARGHALLACVAGVPLLIFLVLSAKKVIGLHWVMAFYPFVFVMLALALPARGMRPAARGMAIWLGLHLLVVAGIAATDLQDWRKLKHYHRLVEALRSSEMVAQADAPGVVLASNVYSSAALFGYAAGRHVPVLGVGSVHARQDDLVMDHAALEGRTVRVLATRKPEVADYAPYFKAVRLLTFEQDGVPFYAVEGQGFSFAAYRRTVLAEVNRRYYQFPAWLPVRGCIFCERYCGQVRCAP